jgi:hypothetical protein
MDHAGLTRLLLRIAGLLGIAMAIGGTENAVAERLVDGVPNGFIGILLVLLVPLGIGLLLMVKAGSITNRLVDDTSRSGSRTDMAVLEGAALCAVGWYLFAISIADGIGLLERAYLFAEVPPPPDPMRYAQIDYSGQICATAVRLLIGLTCIFASRRVVSIKDRLLTALSSAPAAK